mgnify:CR=1 FL=1
MTPEVQELLGWMRTLKDGPLRLFMKVQAMIEHLAAAQQQMDELAEKTRRLEDDYQRAQRDVAERQVVLDRLKAENADTRKTAQLQLQQVREERAALLRAEEARLAAVQEQTASAQAHLTDVQRQVEAAQAHLDTIKGDTAARLKKLEAVAT